MTTRTHDDNAQNAAAIDSFQPSAVDTETTSLRKWANEVDNNYDTLNLTGNGFDGGGTRRTGMAGERRLKRRLLIFLVFFLLVISMAVPILNRQLADTTKRSGANSGNGNDGEEHTQEHFSPTTSYMTFQPKYDIARISCDSFVLVLLSFTSILVFVMAMSKSPPENDLWCGYSATKCQSFWTALVVVMLSGYAALWKIDCTPRYFELVQNRVSNIVTEPEVAEKSGSQLPDDGRTQTNSNVFETNAEKEITGSTELSLVVPTLAGKTKVFPGITAAKLVSRSCQPSKYEKVPWEYYFSFTESVRSENEHWWEPRHSAMVTVSRCDWFVPLTGLVRSRHEPCNVCVNPTDPKEFSRVIQEFLAQNDFQKADN